MAASPKIDAYAAAFKFDNLEKPVRTHLKNVYSCLAMTGLAAALGSAIHLFTNIFQGGLLSSIGSMVVMMWLLATPHTRANLQKRLGILIGFGVLSGLSLGPLMDHVIQINPQIIMTALLATTVIFVCFSLTALFSERRAWLYMGGTLFSTLSILTLLSLLNIFIGSRLIFDATLYIGLLVMCAFVLYDTQLIVEKRRRGDDDYIWHSVDLFLDFITIFRKLMIILSNKENDRKRRN